MGDVRVVGEGGSAGGCAVMLRQLDASTMRKSTPLGLSVVQAHKESVRMGVDTRV
jgi:hypothetical protein